MNSNTPSLLALTAGVNKNITAEVRPQTGRAVVHLGDALNLAERPNWISD